MAITYLYKLILQLRGSNSYIASCFIYFATAFDSVNHSILLAKLEHYGMRGLALKLFTPYLNNR